METKFKISNKENFPDCIYCPCAMVDRAEIEVRCRITGRYKIKQHISITWTNREIGKISCCPIEKLWHPADEPPKPGVPILVTCENEKEGWHLGRYEVDAESGSYKIGDRATSFSDKNLVVRAWMYALFDDIREDYRWREKWE